MGIFKKIMWIFIFILVSLALVVIIILNQTKFGKNPDSDKIDKIKSSANFSNGEFRNLSETPVNSGGDNLIMAVFKFLTQKVDYLYPTNPIPFVKTDLKSLDINSNIMVWFGHSSYFFQLDGKKILIDPVFSGNAAPFSSMVKAFKGSDWYKPEHIPAIDYLFISHDHWNHLDYKTLMELKNRINTIVCPLGVGSHLVYWGFDKDKIVELDWYEKADKISDFEIYATPTRHFSGRSLQRNKTLWTSFVIKTRTKSLYIGGDSGYDTHFETIGNKYGPFDLAILELGQYNENWKYIHLLPKYFFVAASDLKAKKVMGGHNSKFALAQHAWFDPLVKISELSSSSNIPLITPMIGEVVNFDDTEQQFTKWWVGRQ